MATISATILKADKRGNGTWNVKIRVWHNKKPAYIDTAHHLGIKQVTKKSKGSDTLIIKDNFILDSPLQIPVPFSERLACMEPIKTKTGIEIAIQKMLENMCKRMQSEGKGLRTGILTGYRIDGKVVQIAIGTSGATHSVSHLFKLFQLKIDQIRPALGIELFVLDAPKVDDVEVPQEEM
ncbi:hypothetical protein EV200_104246 [Pedobacter psychrotolerans]|uniref:Uncharacterized protein n=1 Tax=Pedobacter psychrotolerans TaxID=1843235 RepID=A0A4R2HC19_9SPHI|nr:hypothetical protein [Pedobacter psychrotolerans]TCO25209.1 hypothetical protein EV200_104246 [Pedobacter psychrotolerans]GGE47230.1 hypothetical protein GCM10011413_11700 [Pedobacter psychrotolerans]